MVVIIGVARSGTSILGELMATAKGVTYLFEPCEWNTIVEGSDRLEERHLFEYASNWKRWYSKYSEPLLVKSPRAILKIPFLQALWPETKFVHIVRDGRDVVCSWYKGMKTYRWGHLLPPSHQDLESLDWISRAAHSWVEALDIVLNDLKEVDHIQIKYEELLDDPLREVDKLERYLGWNLDRTFCDKIADSTQHPYHAKLQDQWFVPDHKNRVGRHKENLSQEKIEMVEEITKETLIRLGYEKEREDC